MCKDNRNRGQAIAVTVEEKRMIYNCEKEILYPPKKFIPYNSTPGEYKESIRVDKCIAKEIEHLWSLGVVTLGCCCGHGRHLGFINVDEKSVPLMKELGYEHYIFEEEFGGTERKDSFIPKSYGHIYNGYSDGFQG